MERNSWRAQGFVVEMVLSGQVVDANPRIQCKSCFLGLREFSMNFEERTRAKHLDVTDVPLFLNRPQFQQLILCPSYRNVT
jgi:hypothetical protein